MMSNLKIKTDYETFEHQHYDAHIKAYQNRNLGIEVVMCDNRGIPQTHKIEPMGAYLEHKVCNI